MLQAQCEAWEVQRAQDCWVVQVHGVKWVWHMLFQTPFDGPDATRLAEWVVKHWELHRLLEEDRETPGRGTAAC
eukprot:CAMPEP_0174380364 /NCGR_PEP_ID=MMETSP0811_2-20130205/123325_1 /TAXON_ID=73025 ORGANISM="Eutreptiella gymnastica-like, Strain CCMP1594" /NCGR_SAMPLE_ID=MMETSP0811_2 /ASSEMBLY_ACC=CAM_ASM_000667 /LENGTH=73 /DNA_ID=CAMNT_0015533203 /DNA_START=622 /DNA_END=843 /DNA_ORIENTATION=+